LPRHLAEFDFRCNHRTKAGYDDQERAVAILEAIKGRRLTYRQTYQPANWHQGKAQRKRKQKYKVSP
jgi:hypothetical protein